MYLDPEDLLLGPRGRRLCLELIQRIVMSSPDHEELSAALFYGAHDLEPVSSSVATITAGTGEPAPRPSSTPADVGRLLGQLIIDPPPDLALLTALDVAVANARYWQEPDGMDVLGATPEVRQALGPAAAAIAAAPGVGWWTTPVDLSGQWLVGYPHQGRPVAADARTVLSRWRTAALADEVRARHDRPADPRASISGTWWSIPPAELPRTTRFLDPHGPVGLWLIEDALGHESATTRRAVLPDDPTVYEIDGPRAWAELCERYPLEVTADRRHDWFRATGRDGRWCLPDWAGVAADYDAVHLTMIGYLSAAGRALRVSDDFCSVIAGWDPDATWWLTDLTVDDESRRDWTYDHDLGWIDTTPPVPTES